MQLSNTSQTKIPGIDVSIYQGKIDWQRVKQAGIKFAFVKATEGATFQDKLFKENIRAAQSAGISCGAYHFFRPKTPIGPQVDNFINSIRSAGVTVLPALDLEVPADWRNIPRGDRINLVIEWLERVKSVLGIPPIIYLSSSFPGDVLTDAHELAAYPLWLAHYTKHPAPVVPAPWQTYTFWQHSDRGAVEGIVGNVDLNWFNGPAVDLEKVMHPHQP
ncbi:MAG: glycoside hydrolase family 25 protein [Cyanobacteria bacterium SZAS-4]|nr:glycoside hydrolase family 25 protein [Cyanobacteria bacterium SZAS-4]